MGVVIACGLGVIVAASGQGLVTGWDWVPDEEIATLRGLGTALTLVALVALAWVRGRGGMAGAAEADRQRRRGDGTSEDPRADELDDAERRAAEAHHREVPLRRHFAMAAKVAIVLVLIALLTPPSSGPDGDPRDGIAGATPDLSSDRPPNRFPPRPGDADPTTPPPPGTDGDEAWMTMPFQGPGSSGAEEAGSRTGIPALAGDALVILLVLAGSIIAVMVAISRLRPPPEEADDEDDPEEDRFRMPWAEAHAGLAGGGGARRPSWGSPRTEVGRAYHTLLDALATAGAPRRFQEGPHEHIRRVTPRLGMDPGPLHALARLHVAVEFGREEATDARTAEAVRLLESSLEPLRQEAAS